MVPLRGAGGSIKAAFSGGRPHGDHPVEQTALSILLCTESEAALCASLMMECLCRPGDAAVKSK